jgi:hypothetical protein
MLRYVLWSRIDQKTCLKAITLANLLAVIEPKLVGDELRPTWQLEAKLRVGPRVDLYCHYNQLLCAAVL